MCLSVGGMYANLVRKFVFNLVCVFVIRGGNHAMWVCKPIVPSWLLDSISETSDGDFWISFRHLPILCIWHLESFLSCAMSCDKISPGECDFSYFAFVLYDGDLWYFSFLLLHLMLIKFQYAQFHFKVSMCKLFLSCLCEVFCWKSREKDIYNIFTSFLLLASTLRKKLFPLLLLDRHLIFFYFLYFFYETPP